MEHACYLFSDETPLILYPIHLVSQIMRFAVNLPIMNYPSSHNRYKKAEFRRIVNMLFCFSFLLNSYSNISVFRGQAAG
jgi:hypothetical protein